MDAIVHEFKNIESENWEFNLVLTMYMQISLYGGQVLSWKNEQGDELLFMSSKV